MAEINISKKSPRIENNIIYWYVGNTFTLKWTINLFDGTTPIVYSPTDTLTWNFYSRGQLVETFEFTNITSTNTVILDFDSLVTAKFGIGEYIYCIQYNGENLTTVGANGKVVVEKCH
jgi:hypothetical protein